MTRLDKAILERGLVRSRTEAQRLIAEAQVVVNGAIITRAAHPTLEDADIAVQGARNPFVSRGGQKLKAALLAFPVLISGRRACDVGASTGGWTDCLLQHGAKNVLALDVGHGQIDAAIASDPRVIVREGVNARFLTPADVNGPFDIVTADLSFISLTLVLPALISLLVPDGDMILLVKPQFEVGTERLGRGGIVRSEADRQEALAHVLICAVRLGMIEHGRMDCPLTGEHGNQEFLLWLKPEAGDAAPDGET